MGKKCEDCELINFAMAISCKRCGSTRMVEDEGYYFIDEKSAKISWTRKIKYFGFACLAEFVAILVNLPLLAAMGMRHSGNAASRPEDTILAVIAFISHFPSSFLCLALPPLMLFTPFLQLAFFSYFFHLIGEGKLRQKKRQRV